MPRVGFDGRDLLRKRTGVVNNTVYLARELSAAHPTDFLVYVDRTQPNTFSSFEPDGIQAAVAESSHATERRAAAAETQHR